MINITCFAKTILMGTTTEAYFSQLTIHKLLKRLGLLIVHCSAFILVTFWDLSVVCEYAGSVQMTSSYMVWQTANWKSSHQWKVLFVIDLATFCDVWSSKHPQFTSFGYVFRLTLAVIYPHFAQEYLQIKLTGISTMWLQSFVVEKFRINPITFKN